MPQLPSLPEQATLFDLLTHYPDIGKYVVPVNDHVMRGPSPLSPKERELIAAFVSTVNSCDYCAGSHSEAAKAFGVPEQTITMLVQNVDTASVDEKLKPLPKYVEKLTRTPARMTIADADAVYAAGWEEDALLSAILVCCVFNFMNRLVEGTGLPASEQQAVFGGRFLFEKGYAAVPAAADAKTD